MRDDRRFEEELAAFAEDRAAFRTAIIDLKARGEAVLAQSERLGERSDRLTADLERLKEDALRMKEDIYKKMGVTLERVETQREEAERVVTSAGEAIDSLRSQLESEVAALRSRLEPELRDLQTQAAVDVANLTNRTTVDLEKLKARVTGDFDALQGATQHRIAALEARMAEIGERLDAANEGMLQASADITELIERLDDLQAAGGLVAAQVDRGARAVARVASRARAMGQLRWAIGLVAIGLGFTMAEVSVALGVAWGNARLGWILGIAEALPWIGIGGWVLWLAATDQAGKPNRSAAPRPPAANAAAANAAAADPPEVPLLFDKLEARVPQAVAGEPVDGLPDARAEAGRDGR
jgi:hypothetical protein